MSLESLSSSGRVRQVVPDGAPLPIAGQSSGAVPAAKLMQWISDDEAAIDFSVLWTSGVGPIAFIVDWRLLPVALVPVAFRLARRRVALGNLNRNGISHRSIQQALQWVDEHEERPQPYSGWRLRLHQVRQFALVATVAGFVVLSGVIELKPWEFSKAGQTAFSEFLTVWWQFGKATLLLIAADAVLTPRPIFGSLRVKALARWRSFIRKRYVAPFAEPDAYQLLAEREVEQLVEGHRHRNAA